MLSIIYLSICFLKILLAADPNCLTGILRPNTDCCCNRTCNTTCGGSGCSLLPGGSTNCCCGTITSSGIYCLTNDPPCILGYPPSQQPTLYPTYIPTNIPTEVPTNDPTANPTQNPTNDPTINPTFNPTGYPSSNPTKYPTFQPTSNPIHMPSINPTPQPTTKEQKVESTVVISTIITTDNIITNLESNNDQLTYLMIGSGAAGLLMILGVIIVIFVLTRKRNKQKNNKKNSKEIISLTEMQNNQNMIAGMNTDGVVHTMHTRDVDVTINSIPKKDSNEGSKKCNVMKESDSNSSGDESLYSDKNIAIKTAGNSTKR